MFDHSTAEILDLIYDVLWHTIWDLFRDVQ